MRSKLMIRVFMGGYSMMMQFMIIIVQMLKEINPKTKYHKKINEHVKTSKKFRDDVTATLDIMPDDEADWDDIYKAANEFNKNKEEENVSD